MHLADTAHPQPSLQDKLASIYTLRRDEPKVDLRIRDPYLKLLEKLGNPQDNLPPVIHVAGTNGKGSVIANIRAILEKAGYKAHVYTSPHLHRFNERIVVGGHEIGDDELEALLDEVLATNEGAGLTFFEITTALALTAFARHGADIVLLETGLGGRLDCTNVVKEPAATIITNIGLDHTEFLGTTLEAIATEKAGILKPGRPVIIAPQDFDEVYEVIETRAKALNAPVHRVIMDKNEPSMRSSMTGPHQVMNTATALKAIESLEAFSVSKLHIQDGLKRVHWPARMQHITDRPLNNLLPEGWEFWFDGGHNPPAAGIIAAQAGEWEKQDGKKLHIIMGMMKNKDRKGFIAPLLPHLVSITFIPVPGLDKSSAPEELASMTGPLLPDHCTAHTADTLHDAVAAICAGKKEKGRILVTGSLYLYAAL